MNSKIALSALSSVVALTLVVGATFAYFSSSASNNGNTFGSGTMTLNINGAPASTSTPVFSVSDAKPGDTSTQVLNLSNTGTVGASTTTLTGIDVTPTGSPNLGGKLTLDLYDDVDDSGTITGGDTVIHSAHLTDASWTSQSLGFGLAASAHHKVIAKITFDTSADDTYQGKSVSFNFNFKADQ